MNRRLELKIFSIFTLFVAVLTNLVVTAFEVFSLLAIGGTISG
jgi:hypothetical protein